MAETCHKRVSTSHSGPLIEKRGNKQVKNVRRSEMKGVREKKGGFAWKWNRTGGSQLNKLEMTGQLNIMSERVYRTCWKAVRTPIMTNCILDPFCQPGTTRINCLPFIHSHNSHALFIYLFIYCHRLYFELFLHLNININHFNYSLSAIIPTNCFLDS